jgi:hypothetical protein
MVTSPARLGTTNDCAGEGQQFTLPEPEVEVVARGISWSRNWREQVCVEGRPSY